MPERLEYREEQRREIDIVRKELAQIVRLSEGAEREKQLHAYVQRRIAELESRVRPVVVEAGLEAQVYDGFLHPETVIHLVTDPRVAGFKIDHPKPYEQLVERLADGEKLTIALQETIDKYFGKPDKKMARELRPWFYYHRNKQGIKAVSLSDLWGRNMAMCAERAALAQNLLVFLGHESSMMGGFIRFDHPEKGGEGFHAWNIVRKENGSGVLYDPNNPTENGPALHGLDAIDLERIRGGRPVVVHRHGGAFMYNAPGGEKYRK